MDTAQGNRSVALTFQAQHTHSMRASQYNAFEQHKTFTDNTASAIH